jgi:hypothetical protein
MGPSPLSSLGGDLTRRYFILRTPEPRGSKFVEQCLLINAHEQNEELWKRENATILNRFKLARNFDQG